MATSKTAKAKTAKSRTSKINTSRPAPAKPKTDKSNRASKAPQKAAKGINPDAPVFVIFGRDAEDKPRAAHLAGFNGDLVNKAARLMGYRACETTYGDHPEIIKRLPMGRIYADGKALAPIVSQDTYDLITKAVGGDLGKIAIDTPTAWADVAPGHLVLAQQTATDGWWEAVVVERDNETVKIKWRDFPLDEPIVRRLQDVALLGPLAK